MFGMRYIRAKINFRIMKQLFFLLPALLVLFACNPKATAPAARDYYALRVYHFYTPEQEKTVEDYLRQAFVPAAHRAGFAKVGVFKPHASDTLHAGKRLFVLLSAASLDALAQLPYTLLADAQHNEAGKSYLDATQKNPPYARMETSFLQAFSGSLHLETPDNMTTPRTERVYEIRSYESTTEKLFVNKVKMFNDADEIGLFKRLGFNAVFYGEALSGAHMPNLVYMICFDSLQAREEKWKAFLGSPEWKHMNTLAEYQEDNVSHIDSYLVVPVEGSDY